jgi:hypothetical protein
MITEQEKFLKELKDLCNKYKVEIYKDYGWSFDGEDESEYLAGIYFKELDISLEITDGLLERK